MVTLKTEKITLKLEVVPVRSLLEHEETLPHLADKLLLEFKNWANLQNPIIVDENHIVLDGHHRTYAFKKLAFRYIPVCKIDYFSQSIGLRYWFRRINRKGAMDELERIVKEMGCEIVPARGRESLMKALEKNTLSWGIQAGSLCVQVRFPEARIRDATGAYALIDSIQNRLRKKGGTVSYIPCDIVRGRHEDRKPVEQDDLIICTPHITKDMVVASATKGDVLPPKTTRHLIPARPLNVNVPVRWFREDLSLERINRRFSEYLEKKSIRHFGPGQVIDGRYYEEELFVFYDH
jgi:hypothetical protein